MANQKGDLPHSKQVTYQIHLFLLCSFLSWLFRSCPDQATQHLIIEKPCELYIYVLHNCSFNRQVTIIKVIREAVWSSGLGHWVWNLEVPGSNPPPCHYLDLFSVAPSSTPQPRCVNSRLRCVNSQLVSLLPVGILNSLCYIYNICLFIYSVPN